MENRFTEFSNLIMDINRSIQKIKNEEMSYVGMKGNQVLTIYNLYIFPSGLSHSQLSKACNEDKGAMTRILRELESEGFLTLSKSGYKSPILLTEKGQKIGQFIAEKIDQRFKEGCLGIDGKERERFYLQLSQINENLKSITKKYGGKND